MLVRTLLLKKKNFCIQTFHSALSSVLKSSVNNYIYRSLTANHPKKHFGKRAKLRTVKLPPPPPLLPSLADVSKYSDSRTNVLI